MAGGCKRLHLLVLAVLLQVLAITASTNSEDFIAIKALKDMWENVPSNWDGVDPCGNRWDGINCADDRIISITLASINLHGRLSSDISKLSELQILDLSYNKEMTGSLPLSLDRLQKLTSLILVGCGFSGPIPHSIGSLPNLVYLSLNSNFFVGEIPPSIGNLSNLYWLDLADNKLSGSIPVSDGSSPGLDLLINARHFHFGNNLLSGDISPQLFNSRMILIHLLFENNKLTGSIPSTIGLVQSLESVRLDSNSFSGPVPKNLDNLTSVQELFLANNKLTGPLPNLTGMELLHYLDLSNNSFDATDVPKWLSSLLSLTTLIMENTRIQGELPALIFSQIQLQTVMLRYNKINGTLDFGSNYSSQLQLIDLRNNFVTSFTKRAGSEVTVMLADNPICDEGRMSSYCTIPQEFNTSYSTRTNCLPLPCDSDKVSSPNCQCAFPYTGILYFRSPSFSNFGNSSVFIPLEEKLMNSFKSNSLPVDSISISNPRRNSNSYLMMNLQVFPSGQHYFNATGITGVGFILSNQTFKPPYAFGPFFFIGDGYSYFSGRTEGKSKSSTTRIIFGIAIGGLILLLLLLVACVYAFYQKRRAQKEVKKNNPFASWDSNPDRGGVPQIVGAKSFSFEELKKCTNNFSETNCIGTGGYGKVYRGSLSNGNLVAIKRAQQGSMQGVLEFKTEIELLSRVHHKNVVSLVGFCFDRGEQMLVYEYITNGTLKDGISGRSGIRLDWMRRLRIALGAGRGLQYLHDLANPPIIHRDIKSTNILLDQHLNAKVADFGLSKLKDDSEKGHVSTKVKGTMGYLDPEYYMTERLTEKSDVYSFGILLLELATAKKPIERGKHIVGLVRQAIDRNKDMYNLEHILDPLVASSMEPKSLEEFIDLALKCVQEEGTNRPLMSEVVKEIEYIMELAGMNPNAESASTSASYEKDGKDFKHPYNKENMFSYSGEHPSSNITPE